MKTETPLFLRSSLRQCKVLNGGGIHCDIALESESELAPGFVLVDKSKWIQAGLAREQLDTLHDLLQFRASLRMAIAKGWSTDFYQRQVDEMTAELTAQGVEIPTESETILAGSFSYPTSRTYGVHRGGKYFVL